LSIFLAKETGQNLQAYFAQMNPGCNPLRKDKSPYLPFLVGEGELANLQDDFSI
jgi:hypothetical protein